MHYIIYFILAFFATTVGSLTGMGGGVIIKPLMDVLGDFDVQTIGVISSITVFSMSLVSIIKHIRSKTEIPFKTAIPLSVGSVLGGYIGQKVLDLIVDFFKVNDLVTIIQNVVLAVLILFVILYMKNKHRIKSKHLKGLLPSLAAGVFLGCCSSFLGIGGGPINVALIIYLFSVSSKTATVCSIMTILFAQISKLSLTFFTTGFSSFDLSITPVMIIAAISGGFLGAHLNKKCSEKTVETAFNCVQVLVLVITVYNIVSNI